MPKKIIIPAMSDLWDEATNSFISIKEQTLVIEHSLLSVSKWEQKHKKAFLEDTPKTEAEVIDYIRCMTINNVNESVYDLIPMSIVKEIEAYIEDPMTATTFQDYSKQNKAHGKSKITCEEIYYKMLSYGIPLDFEKRHFNHLIALLRVFDTYGGNAKKMSASEAAALQKSVNEKRRRKKR